MATLTTAIEEDDVFRAMVITDAAGKPLPEAAVDHMVRRTATEFLNDYFMACPVGSDLWDEGRFDTVWHLFSAAVSSGEGEFELIAPLYNFHLAGAEEVDLTEEIRIGELAPSRRLQITEQFGVAGMPWELGTQFFLIRPLRVGLKGPTNVGQEPWYFREAVASIRLQAGGMVFISDITMVRRPGTPVVLGATAMRTGIPPSRIMHLGGTRTMLSAEQGPAVGGMIPAVATAWAAIPVAFERVDAASAKWLATERLVDLVIALEAVLLPESGGQGELAFRLALTGAWLLGQDPAERADWFGKLRTVYGARSKVVHGSAKAAQRATPDVVENAWEATRRLLRQYVDAGVDHKSWERHIAQIVLG